MRLSLRARLTLWFSLVMGLSLGVFGVLTYTSVSSELLTNLDHSLNDIVSVLDVIIRKQKVEPPPPPPAAGQTGRKTKGGKDDLAFLQKDSLKKKDSAIKPAIKPLPEDDGLKPIGGSDPLSNAVYESILLNNRNFMIQIMDSSGAIVYRSAKLGKDSLMLPEAEMARAKDSVAYIFSNKQVFHDGKEAQLRIAIARTRSAYIIAAYPIDEVQSLLEKFFGTLILLVPGVLLLSTIGGWFLSKASLHPVDEIARTAQDITASNLSRRLPVPSSDDEIRRLSETLNDMISRLESSFERIRQFTADASHELRTPLTILTGELELALRSKKTAGEYQEILSSALQEVLRLSRVVESLLLLSRSDMGRLSLHMERMNITEMLADLADAATILGASKNIYITYRHSEELFVSADHAKLYQMFLNLVDNAVKYTPEGGLISITLHGDNGSAEVRVRDTGIGISAEHQKKIFDRFYRVDKARSRELGGTGLGLSIVQWTVQAHGGTIRVESEPGQGSTFIVRIPLLDLPVDQNQISTKEPEQRRTRRLPHAFDLPKILKKGG